MRIKGGTDMKDNMKKALEALQIVAEDLNAAGADSLADSDIISAVEDATTEMAVLDAMRAIQESSYYKEA